MIYLLAFLLAMLVFSIFWLGTVWIKFFKRKSVNSVYQFMKSSYAPIPKIENKQAFTDAINNKRR